MYFWSRACRRKTPTQFTVFGDSVGNGVADKRCAAECRSQPNTHTQNGMRACGPCLCGRFACGKEYSTLCRTIRNSVWSYMHSVRQHKNSSVPRSNPYCLLLLASSVVTCFSIELQRFHFAHFVNAFHQWNWVETFPIVNTELMKTATECNK